jgi:hypothetical protein
MEANMHRHRSIAPWRVFLRIVSLAAALAGGIPTVASAQVQDGIGVSIVSSADGRLEVFAARRGDYSDMVHSGGIFHIWQNPSGVWNPNWLRYGPAPDTPGAITSTRDYQGRVVVGWLSQGHIWFAAAAFPGAGLAAPQQVMVYPSFGSLAVARDADNRLEFVGKGSQYDALTVPQTGLGQWSFGPVYQLAGTSIRTLSAAPVYDGRLSIMASGGPNTPVTWISQIGPNGAWGHWLQLDNQGYYAIAMEASIDHRLEAIGLGADQRLYHRYEPPTPPPFGGYPRSWSAWKPLGNQKFGGNPLYTHEQDGSLEVFAVDPFLHLLHARQPAPNQSLRLPFTPVADGGPAIAYSAVALDASGRLAVAGMDSGDKRTVWVTHQASPNSDTWAPWTRLPPAW